MNKKGGKSLDERVLEYLRERPSGIYANCTLAKQLGVSDVEMREALEGLLNLKLVRTQLSSGRRKFGVMLPEYEPPAPEPEEPSSMRPYVPPKHLQELYESIVEHRLAFPSKFDR